MNPFAAVAILIGLIAVSTALGLVWKARTGRLRTRDGSERVALPEIPTDSRATLLQFSTEVCAYCPSARRVLGQIADSTDGVRHVDVDLTHRPDLATRFNVLQTPTTFILDADGTIRARIGGAPRPVEVRAALESILTAQAA
jgi:thiol-disulfide isomerase/thioredoxin